MTERPRRAPASAVLSLMALTAACDTGVHTIRVTLEREGEAVAADVYLLPYDLAGIIDSLTAVAARPQPENHELVSRLLAYEPPAATAIDAAASAWRSIRDTVAALSSRLSSMDPTDSRYVSLYQNFRAAYGRMIRSAGARERATMELLGDGRELAVLAAAAADSLRDWEAEALAGLQEAIDHASEARETVTAESLALGVYEAEVSPGPWWIFARARHPVNPFAEYVWYQPITVTRWKRSYPVPLGDRRMELRWRH
ncbi:MAG: hypothetical protein ACE5FJ_05965 [Gemmatimonadales bacterium]